MIDIKTRIHGRFTLECKFSYKVRRKLKRNAFWVNMWVFVPNSLDINASTYERADFYKDIRSYIRLITPVFLLREMVSGTALPLKNLSASMSQLATQPTRSHVAAYEYQIKMFSVIFKRALHNHMEYVCDALGQNGVLGLIEEFLDHTQDILNKYKQLAHVIQTPTVSSEYFNYYLFGYEFMSNIAEKVLYRTIVRLEKEAPDLAKSVAPRILEMLEQERQYKIQHHFLVVDAQKPQQNNDLVFRLSALKKYVESDLFLDAKKKRDGFLAEQVYYSIAAGLSMIFATAIAFMFQLRYGNFTIPLFVALVVSYMLKDRIKELMRYYFAHKKSARYFDNKTKVSMMDREIAVSKEGFDFVPESKLPPEVLKVRNRIPLIAADNRYANEKIILYRKMVEIDRDVLSQSTNYQIDGIVEIMRFNLMSFLRKTDDPEFPLYLPDGEGSVKQYMATRNYYLNIVLQWPQDDGLECRRYRVALNRNGICDMKEVPT